jgi:lipid A 4'-phosphatase
MKRGSWFWPLLALAGGTILFRLSELDLAAARAVWAATETWASSSEGWWGLLYRVTPWPAFALILWSLGVLLGSLRWPTLVRHRRSACFLLAALALGPGLLVNAVFKDHLGRPRPVQVQDFGGNYAFLPVLTPGPYHDGHSFPSGHASIAFFLLTPWFILWRYPRLGTAFLVGGLAWGALIGLARVMQGGHWPSDALWSAGFVYFSGYLLAGVFGFRRPAPTAAA